MRIDADTVRHVARLAQLELTPQEVEALRGDLEAILGYVDQLSALDLDDVPPTTHVLDLQTPLRADEVAGVLPAAEVVRNAPERTDSAMVVPKVLE